MRGVDIGGQPGSAVAGVQQAHEQRGQANRCVDQPSFYGVRGIVRFQIIRQLRAMVGSRNGSDRRDKVGTNPGHVADGQGALAVADQVDLGSTGFSENFLYARQ